MTARQGLIGFILLAIWFGLSLVVDGFVDSGWYEVIYLGCLLIAILIVPVAIAVSFWIAPKD